MSKPKGKTPSLIGGTLGRPQPCEVKRACTCNQCGETILKDTECFEIPQLSAPFATSKRYCEKCFESILKQTYADLTGLFERAGAPIPVSED